MDFYGEASSTDNEKLICKSCIHRGDTPFCLGCMFHEWNSEYKGQEEKYGLKDLSEEKKK